MARVTFTDNLQRHVRCPPLEVGGGSLAEVLAAVFREYERVRGYVLDEQGAIRKHVVIFIDGVMVKDRRTLTDAVSPTSEVYVMQALSGG